MELEAGTGNLFQASYSEDNVGKMIKNSKIRITWNFISNDNREHNVTLAWSKTTGKQEIKMDGTEIWFGRNKSRSVLDHNWKTRDGTLKLHILATCAPKVNENFRNYDLLINGQLFASLPYYGQEGSNAPVPPPMGQDNLNSIIQILYPDGYTPPVDKEQQQQRQEEGQEQYSIAVAPPQRDDAMTINNQTTNTHEENNSNSNSNNVSSKLAPIGDLLGGDASIPMQYGQQDSRVVTQNASPAVTTSTSSGLSHQPMADLLSM